jgi:hypothetical protein
MSKPSQSDPIQRKRGRRRSDDGEVNSSVLADLEHRFARFRTEHRRGTRVPAELRAAALAALRQGVSAGDLYRACGIGWSQLETWAARTGVRKQRTRKVPVEDVRVFSVVDAEARDLQAAVTAEDDEIELKLGRWSVRIRLAGAARRD